MKSREYAILSVHRNHPPCNGWFVATVHDQVGKPGVVYVTIDEFGCSRDYLMGDRAAISQMLAEHGAKLGDMKTIGPSEPDLQPEPPCPVRVGERLPNGATVIDVKRRTGLGCWCVLAVQPKGQGHEYVSWVIDSATLACDCGCYHRELADAVVRFAERVA